MVVNEMIARRPAVVVLVDAGCWNSESSFHERLVQDLGYSVLNVISNQTLYLKVLRRPLLHHASSRGRPVEALQRHKLVVPYYPAGQGYNDRLAARLQRMSREIFRGEIVAVIAAEETGVRVADVLAHCLGVSGNDPLTTDLRRNKAAAQNALRKAGLAYIATRVVRLATDQETEVKSDMAAIQDELCAAGLQPAQRWVVKPADGSSSMGVHFCTADEVPTAIASTFGMGMEHFGRTVERVVLQECVEGTEYTMAGTCCAGEVKIQSMYYFEKRGVQQLCKTSITDAPENNGGRRFPVNSMVEYARQCVVVLGLRYGAFNAQFKLRTGSPETPVLVELNARHKGNPSNWYPLHRAVYGVQANQLDAYFSAMIPARRALFWSDLPAVPRTTALWKEVWLPAGRRRGRIIAKHWDRVEQRLPTYHSVREMQLTRENVVAGDGSTHETAGSKVAVVCLKGASAKQLVEDERRLRGMLWEDVIVLEPDDAHDSDKEGERTSSPSGAARILSRHIECPVGVAVRQTTAYKNDTEGAEAAAYCLVATRGFRAGEEVFHNSPEYFDSREYDRILVTFVEHGSYQQRSHELGLKSGTFDRGGGIFEFNGFDSFGEHSCNPNGQIVYRWWGGDDANHKVSYKFVALRDIAANEVLTCDYELSETEESPHGGFAFQCCCGAERCRGVIRG